MALQPEARAGGEGAPNALPAALAQDSGFTNYIHPTALYNELDLRARSRVSLVGRAERRWVERWRAGRAPFKIKAQRPPPPLTPNHPHTQIKPNFLLRNLSYRLPCPAPIERGDG